MDNALAAGQGGTEAAPQSQTLAHETQPNTPLARLQEHDLRPDEHDKAEDTDDNTERRRVVDRLSEQLDINVGLAGVCEHLAALPKKGRTEAVYAAARLTQANAQLAKAMAQLLQVERRQRTIVERIQTPAPAFGHSNASEQDVLVDGLTLKLLRCLDVMTSEKFDPMLEKAEQNAAAKENSAPAALPAA
ncbi:MAG: hypothetical protein KGJ79_05220 [Alphaproteobacteria bacterium]|nr:hypothetical protein [Alphaproteobacteria bacterium]MDE2110521.1 hypothetical protein [Alphaproteobacteria bacterium]MDE2495371.1 hypothetical protein [Alphaproteobacteria bacterium]